MGTGESLSAPERVRRLQTALHAKAKESPGFRFYSLSDKVWRADVLAVAWQDVRRNGGAAGVDGQTVADIEAAIGSTPEHFSPSPHPLPPLVFVSRALFDAGFDYVVNDDREAGRFATVAARGWPNLK